MYQNIATKVLTGECRLSYVHLKQPYANKNNPNAEPKYSVTLLIPKSDVTTYNDIISSRDAAYEEAVKNDWKGSRPQLRSMLIYDGDGVRQDGQAFGPECKGHWVITASSKIKPQVVHISNVNALLAPEDIYSGMYGRVTMNFFAFNTGGNRGIGCGLGNVLKTRDGEPLSSGATAQQDFAGIAAAPVQPQQASPLPFAQPQQASPLPFAQPQQAAPVPFAPGVGSAPTTYATQSAAPVQRYDPITGQPM